MATPRASLRPLAGLKQALRQCRADRQQSRRYATPTAHRHSEDKTQSLEERPQPIYPSLIPGYKEQSPEERGIPSYDTPTPGFRPSQAIDQNRFEQGLRKIKVFPSPRSTVKACPDPISVVTRSQLKLLDPTGARTRLFSDDNAERVAPGDILHVRFKSGDPYSGVVLNIRKRNSPIDTAILLRNQLTRVGVEMWIKVYSPNVEGIEIVQRKEKRARRAKLYYMRKPKHDIGSVEGIVKQYMRQRMGGPMASRNVKGRDANSNKKKSKDGRKGKK